MGLLSGYMIIIQKIFVLLIQLLSKTLIKKLGFLYTKNRYLENGDAEYFSFIACYCLARDCCWEFFGYVRMDKVHQIQFSHTSFGVTYISTYIFHTKNKETTLQLSSYDSL